MTASPSRTAWGYSLQKAGTVATSVAHHFDSRTPETRPSDRQLERHVRACAQGSANVAWTRDAEDQRRKLNRMMELEALRLGVLTKPPEPDMKQPLAPENKCPSASAWVTSRRTGPSGHPRPGASGHGWVDPGPSARQTLLS